MFETFAALFFAHVLADYVLQTETMVTRKSRPLTLLVHIGIVYLTAVIALGALDWGIAVLAGVHLTVDLGKTLWVNHRDDGIKPYLIDQGAHLATIAAISALLPALWGNGIWAAHASNWAPQSMLLIAGAIYATRAGGFAVGQAQSKGAARRMANDLK